ncbi:tRNA wybutosine-synthesizing protein 3 [Fistulifera solaris]|uniref:tRNA(Phe) 7-[(3-amino-3-carboxypropyl)-4-demethylwyosine(37)-N(4)]-methyltransferase n=1 Tax=Fistulifera solaris TaxID=1519565 RepID=A0A1Z5K988_FISSO|nr:tRNA wybutosine-synthesizing protein 3 [Fistulifera solaris]|eukprot:GAX22722.1 tRNA wybutosine-synthesizing protein 3 [Fistulifera solaris]
MLRPDYEDQPNELLPSFNALRQKTLSTLYEGNQRDKSPKGSVDAPIQDLVDLINSHSSFATLSSCSGRIALFDPTGTDLSAIDETNVEAEVAAAPGEASGKGKGKWLLAAHDKVSLEEVLTLLEVNEDKNSNTTSQHSMMSFRFEPMLLHVAAGNLDRGKQLLQIALQRGFRESGLVVTASRVTVAIRSYSLALVIPLMRSGPWQLSTEYLSKLVYECNDRLEENWKRLDDLAELIRKTLFTLERLPNMSITNFHELPNLNLWGHTCVTATSSNDSGITTDIIAFGGYGTGPSTPLLGNALPGAARSSRVYRLRQSADGVWDQSWTEAPLMRGDTKNGRVRGLLAEPIDWSARERSASCILQQTTHNETTTDLIFLFGGRKSPGTPLSDLILFEYTPDGCSSFYQLKGIAGTPPSARWGHTLTSISGDRAFLVGGRNCDSVVEDSFYILSIQKDGSSVLFLQWEKLDRFGDTFCRFDHASCATSDLFMVFGGLKETSDPLAPFSNDATNSDICVISGLQDTSTLKVDFRDNYSCGFGLDACILQKRLHASYQVQVLLSGGIKPTNDEDVSRQPIYVMELSNEKGTWTVCNRRNLQLPENASTGPLVAHSLALLSQGAFSDRGTIRLASVGGGTAGFSFRPCFVTSFCLEMIANMTVDKILEPTEMKKNDNTSKRISEKSLQAIPKVAVTNAEVHVVFVKKQNAKQVKILLENLDYLSETHRMAPATNADALGDDYLQYVALPIKPQALAKLNDVSFDEPPWASLIEAKGQQVLPFRTAMFARK